MPVNFKEQKEHRREESPTTTSHIQQLSGTRITAREKVFRKRTIQCNAIPGNIGLGRWSVNVTLNSDSIQDHTVEKYYDVLRYDLLLGLVALGY